MQTWLNSIGSLVHDGLKCGFDVILQELRPELVVVAVSTWRIRSVGSSWYEQEKCTIWLYTLHMMRIGCEMLFISCERNSGQNSGQVTIFMNHDCWVLVFHSNMLQQFLQSPWFGCLKINCQPDRELVAWHQESYCKSSAHPWLQLYFDHYKSI